MLITAHPKAQPNLGGGVESSLPPLPANTIAPTPHGPMGGATFLKKNPGPKTDPQGVPTTNHPRLVKGVLLGRQQNWGGKDWRML